MKIWLERPPRPDAVTYPDTLVTWLQGRSIEITTDPAERGVAAALALGDLDAAAERRLRRRRVPIVQWLDDLPRDPSDPASALELARLKACYEVAAAVVFPTRFVQMLAASHFGPPNCVTRVIPAGLDTDRFEPIQSGTELRPVTGVCVTRGHGHERLRSVIEGFIALNAELTHSRLMVIGPAERFPEDLPTHHAVSLIGELDADERAWAFGSADILVNLSWMDAGPIELIEAQAAGLPVVCSNSGGCQELLIKGTGQVIDSDPTGVPAPGSGLSERRAFTRISAERIARAVVGVIGDLRTQRNLLKAAREYLDIGRAGREFITLFEDLRSGTVQRPKRRAALPTRVRSVWERMAHRRAAEPGS